ncbi:MAG TPA: protein kinase [Kofleriaceae bacterium]
MGTDAGPRSAGARSRGQGVDPHAATQRPTPSSGQDGFGLPIGTRVGQYELIRELGRGGMGVVYAARDTKLGRRVAIKFLLDATGPVAERFMIEARATAQCTHENIVVIHEVGEHAGRPFMVLEFLDGAPLREKLGAGPVPVSRVVELALAVGRALSRAAKVGIVHRDLKPENVFVTSSGQIKVLDFGIAKARGAAEPRASRESRRAIEMIDPSLTTDGSLIGTLPYMSPEQLGLDQVDHRSDLWAVGIMMFEMLSGRHPIMPFTPETLITNVVTDQPLVLPVASLPPDVPPALLRLIEHCLRKRKTERLPSAAELVRRLEELLPGRRGRALADGECPYPGLSAFQEQDADRFFGRDREITRMVALVRDLPLTAVVGPSGAGKSSFVRAGVVPALKASGEAWELFTVRPGRQPIAALASLVEQLVEHAGDREAIVERMEREPGYLGAVLRERVRATGHRVVLFVDQFEELYTLVTDPRVRRVYTAILTGVADDAAAPLRVVVSMRSDFLDRVAEDPRMMDEVSRGLLVLGPADRVGLREALTAPAEMAHYRFESEAMVDEMLDELDQTPNALPLLQFAASKLWEARDQQARRLTLASYRASGGVSGALATHADQVIAGMTASSRALVQRLFRQLVTPERTRAIAELADLEQLSADRDEVKRVIDQLVAARLLVVQTRSDSQGATVEIVHESLLASWPTLQRWLDEDHEDAVFLAQVSASAKQWDAKQRVPGLLWRGEATAEAQRWYAQRPRQLGEREQAFLDAVFALGRRSKRMRRAALIGTLVVLGAIAVGASTAYVQVRAAEHEASENAARAEAALAAKTEEERARVKAETDKTAALAALMTEEQRRAAAQAGLLTAEQIAAAAKQNAERAVAAREQAQRAQAAAQGELARAEQQLSAAEQDKRAAEAAALQHQAEAQLSREELVAALASARAAREKAEHASARAASAVAEAEKAKSALEQALAVERARVDKLEDEKRKLATKLK